MRAAPSHQFRAVVLLCTCLCSPFAFAQDTIDVTSTSNAQAILGDAENLIASGQSRAAYDLLKAREQALAGDTLFDYMLGVAALDTGLYNEAIFSLRRAVAVAPDFAGARLELARAYFESDNKSLARSLFVNLLNENPPPGVRSVIHDYLLAIDTRPAVSQARFTPYVGFGAGYDNNANGSTDDEMFNGFTLTPNNLKTDSPFAELSAGFNVNKAMSNRLGWYAGGNLNYRHNTDASFVDSGVISGLVGFNWQRNGYFGRAGFDAYWATRDGDSNSSYGGLDTLFGKRIADQWELVFALRGGALRYDDDIDVLDVDRLLYTGGLNWRFAPLGSLGIEIIGGGDNEKQDNSPHGNSKFGGRIVLRMPVGQRGQLMAAGGSLTSDYDGQFFGTSRKDTQVTAVVQIEFRDVWTDGLSLIPRLRYIDNDSDVGLYDYDRTEFGVLMRWIPQ